MREALRRARAREDTGLSLVEMVVALVVIGIVLAALATALVAGMVAANTAEIRTRAVQLAAKYVEADQSVKQYRREDLIAIRDEYRAKLKATIAVERARA